MRFSRFGPFLLLAALLLDAGAAPAAFAQASGSLLDDLVVTDIRVSRRRVRPGETIRVSMTLRNQGRLVARSQPPAPSTVYAQGESFKEKGHTVQDGRFSIVMTASGARGDDWPWRWGIGGDLGLGKTRRVSYPIRLTTPGSYTIFAGVAVGDGPVRSIPTPNLTGIQVVPSGTPAPPVENTIYPTPPTRITVNNKPVAFDQRPIFVNATVMVPLRFVMESLGAAVQWHRDTRTVTAARGEYDLSLRIGRNYNRVNDKTVYVYTTPRILNGRTMVPLRFVTEALGGTVNWDNRTETIAITVPPLTDGTNP